jgi:hypothetical protein
MFVRHNKDEGYSRIGGYKGVGTVSAIGVVLAVAIMIARPYIDRAGWLAFLSTEKGADISLADDPQMRFIERNFPKDYATIREAIRAKAATGDIAQVRQAFALQIDGFHRRHAGDFAQAPDADFRQLIEMHLQLADTFHMSRAVCARFFSGTMPANDLILPEEQKLLNDFNMARLAAMARGRDAPAGRKTGPVDAATSAMLVDAMRVSGAPFTAMEFVQGKRTWEAMTPDMRCEAGWHLIRSVRGMPIKEGYPLYATLFG